MVRTHRIEVRVTEEEREAIVENARVARRSVSDFVRLRALDAPEVVPPAPAPPSPDDVEDVRRIWAKASEPLKRVPVDTVAQHDAAEPLLQPLVRACERCGMVIASPSLRRHPGGCDGKILPEPS